MIDYFPATVALDPLTDAALEGAVAEVFAIEDTSFTTPLSITDIGGVPMANLVAGPTGIFPAFRVDGYTQVVPKVGDIVSPPITSQFGPVLMVLPDPTDEPDGRTIVTQGGVWVTTTLPDGGGGGSAGLFTRQQSVLLTASLAPDAQEADVVELGKKVDILTVELSGPARVRLYDTTAHRDADAARPRGTDPDPSTNHGVMLDFALDDADTFSMAPAAPVFTLDDTINVPYIVDNLDGSAAAVSVTFTFLRTE